MKLKQKGRYLEIPIVGLRITKIVYDGHLRLVLNDEEKSYLDLDNVFIVEQYNQQKKLHPAEKESLIFFYDQFAEEIKEAIADRNGNLWVTFQNGTRITVEDGPYENWHYTKMNLRNKINSVHVHGGAGSTTY
jgi:hypothetical protein